jgi:hypothetical protein
MTIFAIHHACGHSWDINLEGKPERHPEMAAKLAEQNCPAYRLAEHHAQVSTISVGLPGLEGSRKQVEWAMSLRLDALAWIFKSLTLKASQKRTMRQVLCNYCDYLLRQTEARWWINVRKEMENRRFMHFRGFFLERKEFYGGHHFILNVLESVPKFMSINADDG